MGHTLTMALTLALVGVVSHRWPAGFGRTISIRTRFVPFSFSLILRAMEVTCDELESLIAEAPVRDTLGEAAGPAAAQETGVWSMSWPF